MLDKIRKDLIDILNVHGKEIDNFIDYSRDYLFDYFGFKTLERAYLTKLNKVFRKKYKYKI